MEIVPKKAEQINDYLLTSFTNYVKMFGILESTGLQIGRNLFPAHYPKKVILQIVVITEQLHLCQ